jgi:hypothetical protein
MDDSILVLSPFYSLQEIPIGGAGCPISLDSECDVRSVVGRDVDSVCNFRNRADGPERDEFDTVVVERVSVFRNS